jgi:glycosyltransferase involved in cell wall biosynthesis
VAEAPALSPLRVLVVSRPSNVWGAQLRLLLTAPAMRERQIELALAIPPGNAFADRWRDAGYELVPLPPVDDREGLRRSDGRRAAPGTIAAAAVGAARRAAQLVPIARRFDVIHSFSRHAHPEVVAAARMARRPVVVEVVDIVRAGFGRRALRAATRLASAVVVNSSATGETVAGAARRLRVIHPGVDTERFRPGPRVPEMRARLTARPDDPVIAIIGRLDPTKGVETVSRALALAGTGQPGLASATLAVIGDRGVAPDGYIEALRDRVTSELGDRVRFTGRIEDIPTVLRSIEVLVNASDAEPFGRSILEAQATGTPVVATAAGGVPEFVCDGETGLLVPRGDAEALAVALDRVLTDTELRDRIVAGAAAQVRARFASDSRYDDLAAIYRDVVGRAR